MSENAEQVVAEEGPKPRHSGDRVQLHGRDYGGVLDETELSHIFTLQVQADGFANIGGHLVKSGAFGDDGEVHALGDVFSFAPENADVDDSPLHDYSLHAVVSGRAPLAPNSLRPLLLERATAKSSLRPELQAIPLVAVVWSWQGKLFWLPHGLQLMMSESEDSEQAMGQQAMGAVTEGLVRSTMDQPGIGSREVALTSRGFLGKEMTMQVSGVFAGWDSMGRFGFIKPDDGSPNPHFSQYGLVAKRGGWQGPPDSGPVFGWQFRREQT